MLALVGVGCMLTRKKGETLPAPPSAQPQSASDDDPPIVAGNDGDAPAEILLLVGMPIREPVVSSGTWVVSSEAELAQANADYGAGLLGRPWDHTISDDEWEEWNRKYGI